MRALFLFDPPSTWAWLSLPRQLRERLETRVDSVEFPARWDAVGLRQRLAQHDKMDTDEVCRQILQVTGGWYLLLRVLFERCGAKDDPRLDAQQMTGELLDPSSQLRQEFHRSLGLEASRTALRVLDFIRQQGERGISNDFVTPEWIDCDPALTEAECAQAVEYLYRMGCIVSLGGMFSTEPTVRSLLARP